MEAELAALLGLHVVGVAFFGKFESETAWWRIVLKWIILIGLTLTANSFWGHAGSFTVIGLGAAAGLTFHFYWCRKNNIHPLKALPRKRYYALRHWTWNE